MNRRMIHFILSRLWKVLYRRLSQAAQQINHHKIQTILTKVLKGSLSKAMPYNLILKITSLRKPERQLLKLFVPLLRETRTLMALINYQIIKSKVKLRHNLSQTTFHLDFRIETTCRQQTERAHRNSTLIIVSASCASKK